MRSSLCGKSVWLPMHQLQRSFDRSQHPSAQWNLRGGRWSSVEYTIRNSSQWSHLCCETPRRMRLNTNRATPGQDLRLLHLHTGLKTPCTPSAGYIRESKSDTGPVVLTHQLSDTHSILNMHCNENPIRIPFLVLSCVVDHILQEFDTLFLTRFRSHKLLHHPQKNDQKRRHLGIGVFKAPSSIRTGMRREKIFCWCQLSAFWLIPWTMRPETRVSPGVHGVENPFECYLQKALIRPLSRARKSTKHFARSQLHFCWPRALLGQALSRSYPTVKS